MARTGDRFHVDEARFDLSVGEASQIPAQRPREICVVGRSNVGKSSLLNMLVGKHRLAKTSRTPGRTRLVNFFVATVRHRRSAPVELNLVDLPGYGFARVGRVERRRVERLLETYLAQAERAVLAIQLIDSRHEATASDREVFAGLCSGHRDVIVAATKIDTVALARRVVARRRIEAALPGVEVLLTSALHGDGREELWSAIWSRISEV